jgi:hypothetical protein
MLFKIELPEGTKIMKNDDNEVIVDLPKFYGKYQTAVNVFSVNGHTMNDFEKNDAISSARVLITSKGNFEAEVDDFDDGEKE